MAESKRIANALVANLAFSLEVTLTSLDGPLVVAAVVAVLSSLGLHKFIRCFNHQSRTKDRLHSERISSRQSQESESYDAEAYTKGNFRKEP